MEERIRIAEKFFLRQMLCPRQNDIINQAAREIVSCKGTLSVSGLAEECFVSSRQLERLFHEYIGITPKKFCNLVRYQCLWNEILRNPGFRILDAVERYGYTDQSHLMREFKQYHTMDIGKAKMYACHNVENIQYIPRESLV
ncbi:helix-turn-helix domain-containing protein [Schaedlerella arabinosiphila]|jgi:AraC-like DNA-binding protein|uniref:helix-turn-helix domain-containing protein n=1 Tax=Schaedlerella arabinosiphila TaxID=2044587 RepID=UPI003FA7C785